MKTADAFVEEPVKQSSQDLEKVNELEKDVEEKKRPKLQVPLYKIGVAVSSYLLFFASFPVFVYAMRKVVVKVREWRKPRLYYSSNHISFL